MRFVHLCGRYDLNKCFSAVVRPKPNTIAPYMSEIRTPAIINIGTKGSATLVVPVATTPINIAARAPGNKALRYTVV